jgi:hypothetical protein
MDTRRLAADIQDATGGSVELAYVDQGYTIEPTAQAAAAEGIALRCMSSSCRRQARLRLATTTLDRGTILRLGHTLPAPRQRL